MSGQFDNEFERIKQSCADSASQMQCPCGDKSRSQRGLGLGLSLVKAVVEAHQGQVFVTSKVGEGSEFTVTLSAAVVGS